MMNSTLSSNEIKDQKRSKRIAIGIHAILILALLIPMASKVQEVQQRYAEVTIDFRDFKAASAQSAAAVGDEKTEVETAKPAVKPEPVKSEAPEVIKNPVKAAVIENKPAPVKATTKPKVKTAPVKSTPKPTPTKVSVKTPAKTSGNKGAGTEAVQGTGTKGNASTDGKVDEGKQGMDFSGDALFTRRVIKRAEIKQLSKKEGTMVVNLCVNQNGSVVYAEYNYEDSDIFDSGLIVESIQATKKYRFEPDYTAPKKQCGKLTYIVEIN